MLPYRLKTEKKVTLEEAERNYKRLSEAEQNKDTAPMECMLELLKMYDGVRNIQIKNKTQNEKEFKKDER